MLTFLQISDIHFSGRPDRSPHELDEVLRHELLRDAPAFAETIGGISAVLVAGDIAFAGTEVQYGRAKDFLTNLCSKLRVEPEDVWVIPGNHDVERNVAGLPYPRELRARIRRMRGAERDLEMRRMLEDPVEGPNLLSALDRYNKFAALFSCEISAAVPFWTSEALDLGDGYSLRLRGITSALISDAYDDTAENAVFVGAMQTTVLREDHEVWLSLCHHPFEWLLDRAAAQSALDARVAMQVTGHVHTHDMRETGAGWHLATGALQPDRKEDKYEPRYNFISFEVVNDGDSFALQIRVYPRLWNGVEFELDKNAAPPGHLERLVPLPKLPQDGRPPAASAPSQTAQPLGDALRRLRHRAGLLQSGDRYAIADQLGLDVGALASQPPHLAPRFLVAEAQKGDLLRDLWDAVEARQGSPLGPDNPF